jgi:rRNA biogenesis protein RRP5
MGSDSSLSDSRHPFYRVEEGATVKASQISVNKKTGTRVLALVESTQPLAQAEAEGEGKKKKKRRTSSAGSDSDPPSAFAPPALVQWTGSGKVKEGGIYPAVIVRVEPLAAVVALSPYVQARLCYADFSANIEHVRAFAAHAYVGMKVVVAATKVSRGKDGNGSALAVSRIPCEVTDRAASLGSLRSSATAAALEDEVKLSPGQKVFGTLDLLSRRSPAQPYVLVTLRGGKIGRVDVTEVNDAAQWEDLSCLSSPSSASHLPFQGGKIAHGAVVEAVVVQCSTVLYLSLRLSRLSSVESDNDGDDDDEDEIEGNNSAATMTAVPQVGETVTAFVANSGPKGVFLRLDGMHSAHVEKRELSDDFVSSPVEAYPVGAMVRGVVLSTGSSAAAEDKEGGGDKGSKKGKKSPASPSAGAEGGIKLSLKASRVVGVAGRARAIAEMKAKVGSQITGVVRRVDEGYGVFVAIHDDESGSSHRSGEIVGLARRNNALPTSMSNAPLSEKYSEGDVVRALLMSVNVTTQKVSLGLRPGLFRGKEGQEEEEEEEEEEESESEDGSDDDDEDEEEEEEGGGQLLEAMIVDSEDETDDEVEQLVKKAARRAMKEAGEDEDGSDDSGSDSDDDDDDDDDEDEDEEEEDEDDEDEEASYSDANMLEFHEKKREQKLARRKGVTMVEEEDSDDDELDRIVKDAAIDEDEDEDDDDEGGGEDKGSDEDSDEEDEEAPKRNILTRSMGGGGEALVSWSDFKPEGAMDVDKDEDEDSDDDEDDDEGESGGKSRRSKQRDQKKEQRARERGIEKKERDLIKLADGETRPESSDDFERLLMAEPNSSFLWIQFMTFHLESADVDAARAVAKRALAKINYRAEDEKYKVWVAFINMEHSFGNTASLEEVFSKACVESKGKYLHLKLADLYEDTGDATGAKGVYNKALKKYKYSKKVWGAFLVFHLRQKEVKEAKTLLSRAMQSLVKHKHIEFLKTYAMAEFDVGSADRGRQVLEELLASYPKKSDLAHVYLDKEVKCGNYREARGLFARLVTFKYNLKNKMTLFKKYLAFEKAHGTTKDVEKVKALAKEYAESVA